MDIRVAEKYRIGRRLGSGSFGDVFLGVDVTSDNEVAVKLEPAHADHGQLEREANVYEDLAGSAGVARLRWHGREGEYNALVLDRLGLSLEDLFELCQRRFSLKTVLLLAGQMISCLEVVHAHAYVHRDIKPDNFCIGYGDFGGIIHIIDFGISKKYIQERSQKHIRYRENRSLTGTARYTSIRAHLGVEQSRRDDLESLGYVFIYFLQGTLPWQGIKGATKRQKYEFILNKKTETKAEVLCSGLPSEFFTYLQYCRSLGFEETPDYEYLRKLLRDLYDREGFPHDNVFDWIPLQDDSLEKGRSVEDELPLSHS